MLDRLVLGNGVDQFDLEVLALGREEVLRRLAAPDLLGEGGAALDDLGHLLLDPAQIVLRERRVAEEVVVEAVLDHRADRHLRVGPDLLHRLGQHMRGIVPDQLKRSRVVARDEGDGAVVLERIGKIAQARRSSAWPRSSWPGSWRCLRRRWCRWCRARIRELHRRGTSP
jgi:hypothetical protein